MDLSLLDSLADTTGLLLEDASQSSDPFLTGSDPYVSEGSPSPDNYLFLSPDPFLNDPPLAPEPQPHAKNELILHPFDIPAMPLSATGPGPLVPSHAVAAPLSSDGQENRARVSNGTEKRDRPRSGGVKKGVMKKTVATSASPKRAVKAEDVDVNIVKDKLAKRKLRNKESARRYREKQVARRRQLENYTRSLTEQNRELENLHDRLLTLTCERRMRGLEVPFAQVADAIPPGVL